MHRLAKSLLPVVAGSLLLAGCSDSEDFTVQVDRPAQAIIGPLLDVDISEAKPAFPGIKVEVTRPSGNEILYRMPTESGNSFSEIRLQLESVKGGNATVIHAFVDIPPVRATIDGETKVLSEDKVEQELKLIIAATGKALEGGSDAKANSVEFSTLLLGVAIASNAKYTNLANNLKNSPPMLRPARLPFDSGEEAEAEPSPEEAAAEQEQSESGDRSADSEVPEAALGETAVGEEPLPMDTAEES